MQERLRALLIAPPGAGKGTQAAAISAEFGVEHISTGDLFRAEVAAETPLGRLVAAYLEQGDLVPDDLVLELVRVKVVEAIERDGGYLLDGYPRTLNQAEQAHAIGVEMGITAHAAVTFEVPREVLSERLLERARLEGRPDDDKETILHRLDVYEKETASVVDYYDGLGVLIRIDADRPVEEVTAATIAALRTAMGATATEHGPDGEGGEAGAAAGEAGAAEASGADDAGSAAGEDEAAGAEEAAGVAEAAGADDAAGAAGVAKAAKKAAPPRATAGARKATAAAGARATSTGTKRAGTTRTGGARGAAAKRGAAAAAVAAGDGPSGGAEAVDEPDVVDEPAAPEPTTGMELVHVPAALPEEAVECDESAPRPRRLASWPERAVAAATALAATEVLVALGVLLTGLVANGKQGPLVARLGAAFVDAIGTAHALVLIAAAGLLGWASRAGVGPLATTVAKVVLGLAVMFFVAAPLAAWGNVAYLHHSHQAVDGVVRAQLATWMVATMVPMGVAAALAWWVVSQPA
jgi:adenylate kinase